MAPLWFVLTLEELDGEKATFSHTIGESELELSRTAWETLDRPSSLRVKVMPAGLLDDDDLGLVPIPGDLLGRDLR